MELLSSYFGNTLQLQKNKNKHKSHATNGPPQQTNTTQHLQQNNGKQLWSGIKMTFHTHSWNAKSYISVNWKCMLGGRMFIWASAQCFLDQKQKIKLQAAVSSEAKRNETDFTTENAVECTFRVSICPPPYLPLVFLCCPSLRSILRLFLENKNLMLLSQTPCAPLALTPVRCFDVC